MFNERKAAQLAAALLQKSGGSLNVLKLTKLLYLVERESMNTFGFPVIDDYMVSMPKGPVLSNTLDMANGSVRSEAWESLIEDRENHQVRLKKCGMSPADLDELSAGALSVVDVVWERFGQLDQWELVRYTHDMCAEWENPGFSSLPIPAKRVFAALGKTREQVAALDKALQAQQHFDRLFAGEPDDVLSEQLHG